MKYLNSNIVDNLLKAIMVRCDKKFEDEIREVVTSVYEVGWMSCRMDILDYIKRN